MTEHFEISYLDVAIMDTRDWSLCFICQSSQQESKEKALDPSSSVKLRNKPERLHECYNGVIDNIQELKELGKLPDFVAVDDISGGGNGDGRTTQAVVRLMMSNPVVWHKTCRDAINNRMVERARKRKKEEESESPVKTRRMSGKSTAQTLPTPPTSCEPVYKVCLLCGEVGKIKNMRNAADLKVDRKVKESAQVVGDHRLLAQLAGGDMIAIDAVYHTGCLNRLYRKAESVGCDKMESTATKVIRAQVLNELLTFIEDYRGSEESLALSDLTALYDKRTAALGFPHLKCHSTRLREDIERLIPDITSVQMSRGWSLVFDDDLSKAVFGMKNNTSTDVCILFKAAKILRQEYLPMKHDFTGSFSTTCEADSVPPMLRSFLHMLLYGSGIDQPSPGPETSQAAASIGQQIIFNSIKRRKSKNPDSVPRHLKERETPL